MTELSPTRFVDCDCGAGLWRPILFPLGNLLQAAACLRCGRVTLVERLAEEPRPHDVREYANRVVELAPSTLAWIGAWPRRAGDPWSSGATEFYLAASARVADVAALSTLEADEVRAQSPLSPVERLRRAGHPSSPPPSDLPSGWSQLAATWRGLELAGDVPFDRLMSEAAEAFAGRFALELLGRRPELAAELASWLGDPAHERRTLARRVARELRVDDPQIVEALAARLGDDAATARELDGIADVAGALGAPARALAPALRTWAQRLRQTDYYVAKHLGDVAERLARGKP
jgi:hypothetical protein